MGSEAAPTQTQAIVFVAYIEKSGKDSDFKRNSTGQSGKTSLLPPLLSTWEQVTRTSESSCQSGHSEGSHRMHVRGAEPVDVFAGL